MTLKEQILEFIELTGVPAGLNTISNGICVSYIKVDPVLKKLMEEGLIYCEGRKYTLATGIHSLDKEYTEGTDMLENQYQDENLEEWIDEAARTLTPEQFRGAMLFKIGEHLHGIDKKDEIGQEVTKVAYYSCRWEEYESGLLNK